LHIGLNLPPKDNLRKEDKSSTPKVAFICHKLNSQARYDTNLTTYPARYLHVELARHTALVFAKTAVLV